MHQKLFICLGKVRPHLSDQLRLAHVDIAVDKITNYLDLRSYTEELTGAIAKITRDRCNSIRLRNPELGNGQVRTVKPNQSNVGSMQSSNKRHGAAGEPRQLGLN